MAHKTVRAPMPNSRRAKQFQPFDALTGLREAIAAKEATPIIPRSLTEDRIEELNRILCSLEINQVVTVVYYDWHAQNDTQVTGAVTKVRNRAREIYLDSVIINFSDIMEIETDP